MLALSFRQTSSTRFKLSLLRSNHCRDPDPLDRTQALSLREGELYYYKEKGEDAKELTEQEAGDPKPPDRTQTLSLREGELYYYKEKGEEAKELTEQEAAAAKVDHSSPHSSTNVEQSDFSPTTRSLTVPRLLTNQSVLGTHPARFRHRPETKPSRFRFREQSCDLLLLYYSLLHSSSSL